MSSAAGWRAASRCARGRPARRSCTRSASRPAGRGRRPGTSRWSTRPSAGGARLAVSAWDGKRFVVWVIDATSGARIAELAGAHDDPVYDATFTEDGRVVMLEVREGRFQAVVVEADGARRAITDAAYGVLEPRVRGGRVRFLARQGWRWTLDE